MDAGVGIALIIIFFALQFPKGGIFLSWWGNTVWQNTLDAQGAPFTVLPPGQTFGPTIVSIFSTLDQSTDVDSFG